MMGQKIGNVGLLNLLNATEESVKKIERIENVGAVIYRAGTAHLLSALNIGNLGASLELPEDYRYFNGELTVDAAYLRSLGGEQKLAVNGTVIFSQDVAAEDLEKQQLMLIVNGAIYAPEHLIGLISRLFPEGNRALKPYTGSAPYFENSHFTLSNSFLQAAEEPMYLVVNGVVDFAKDLDLDLFNEKIGQIDVNGVLRLQEEQESALHRKMKTAANGVIQIIPAGYTVLNKALRINSRSIRSFNEKKLYTKKPVIFEPGIEREAFAKAIGHLYSKSYIICSEELEDLMYEKLDRLETEVLSYEQRYLWIEGEQKWSEAQFQALEAGTNLIVDGLLILDKDVAVKTVAKQVAAIDNFGEIQVSAAVQKSVLQNKLRANEGQITSSDDASAEPEHTGLQNVGELAL
ncbi:hypothetical protein BN1080_00516 [Planococcus massiliensis]|uniref:Uncharacterized protein n=1 Tax=Planococcus massiliensis TaxID=1499687 RepID=A0A098EH57_9BACL|nr:hypothetical protein [Planococcus massiliensis]CEG21603.1 hypothetical protein BN1080_00516 [Planococcus massiliensis]